MKLELKDNRSKEEVEQSIRDIVSSNRLLSMATGEEPHINTAFYAFDGELNLYILTPPDTVHGQNLSKDNSVAVDIHDSRQKWSDNKQGLQVFGTAEKLESQDRVAEALELYTERFPELGEFASDTTELEELDSRFYRIEPSRIKIFDEPRFGKETWIEVKVR